MDLEMFKAVNSAALKQYDIDGVAKWLEIEPAALEAVLMVETNGRGFRSDDLLTMRFEAHIFEQKTGIHVAGHPNQYPTLELAYSTHPQQALESCSWGLPQIMGFNYGACDHESAADLVETMRVSELLQLKVMGTFLWNTPALIGALRAKDWPTFARYYNGPLYGLNKYDTRLQSAYVALCQADQEPRTRMILLKRGSRSEEVEAVQALLNKVGTGFGPLVVDGMFGPSTEDAVVNFQKAHALVPDGIVGVKTWATMQKYLTEL